MWWAALRAFLAFEREVGGLRDVGDGVVDEVDESLSAAEGGSREEGWRGIMSSLVVEGGIMLDKGRSGSSWSCEGFFGAMALYDCSWRCVGWYEGDGLGKRVTGESESLLQNCFLIET